MGQYSDTSMRALDRVLPQRARHPIFMINNSVMLMFVRRRSIRITAYSLYYERRYMGVCCSPREGCSNPSTIDITYYNNLQPTLEHNGYSLLLFSAPQDSEGIKSY